MTLTASQLEEMVAWCALSPSLAAAREEAMGAFLGETDQGPVQYWPGAGDAASIERRFLGWFMFTPLELDGRRPAEYAAEALFTSTLRTEALQAVRGVRYLLAVVTAVRQENVTLEVGDERLDVHSDLWAEQFTKGLAVLAHVVPVGQGVWLPGPGWCEWPTRIGRGLKRELKQLHFDAIQVERFLQGRSERNGETVPAIPKDSTLEQAVARITEEATRAGHRQLVLSVEEWRALVWRYLRKADVAGFGREVLKRAEPTDNVDEVSRYLQLAMNVWNATPQPDRGGKTAHELLKP